MAIQSPQLLDRFIFADGHVEAVKRPEVVNPANGYWRRRWNNDNLPHNGTDGDAVANWTANPTAAGQLDL